ncbi:MAG: NADH-quinone oxidoreductase subunit J [Dehalococcoidia bacterium]|nr:NADH-quinone oxidoreductase subunit J [Dehalococcoidia bacterium]
MDTGVGITLAFWIMAVVLVASALAVVLLRNIFRSALCLVLAFLTVAGIYVLLQADFLAVVQILIYVGAVAILMIFAIMLTRDVQQGNLPSRLRFSSLLLSALLMAVMIVVVTNTGWSISAQPPSPDTTSAIAKAVFAENGGFVLPFEIVSVLLLAAIIGAVVLVREK